MFELVVMPLTELWADGSEETEGFDEALTQLQQVLTEQVGHKVTWKEEAAPETTYEADGVDPYCIYGLRAAAAWLEFEGTLDTFEVGDEPWDHPALERFDNAGRSEKFPQLLHSDESYWTAFVPADLPDIFVVEEEEDSELGFSVGSLPALRRELDALRPLLGLEDGVEDHIDDIVLDPDEDPLAGPRYGWLVLSARTNEALEKQLPLMLLYEPGEDDEDDDDHEDHEGHDHF